MTGLDVTGEVVYGDDGAVVEVLVSHLHGLTGKPDYIQRDGEELIPVERKSRIISEAGACEGEILQLAASDQPWWDKALPCPIRAKLGLPHDGSPGPHVRSMP